MYNYIQIKQEEAAIIVQEKLQRQIEEEEKNRKKEEFLARLDEQQQQLAREAEIIRTIKEKNQKERQEEELREKKELKLMAQHDNFYVITPAILGGGSLSLQRRLFSRAPSVTLDNDDASPHKAGHSRGQSGSTKSANRISSAKTRKDIEYSAQLGNYDKHINSRVFEKSVSAGSDSFKVPGELQMTMLFPTGPDGLLEHGHSARKQDNINITDNRYIGKTAHIKSFYSSVLFRRR